MTQQEFFARYTYKPSTDKLGGGAFGTVFKAYDETLGKYIAIKVAEQKHIGDRILSLADEFNALKNIQDHKNIAKYDVFYTFEQPTGVYDFALMQYYPDGNLSQLIKKGNLTTAQKENLALQLLNGISFLHQNNVVHRDLKPSNILIQKHELTQEYIPKITDFGLSKKANTDKGTQFTNSFAAGTYAYSSPEQLKGEILRFNTDLWAYGAIVYEIFTGKTMFNIQQKTGSSALDIKDILDNILNNDITHKITELPTKWQPAVTACLERNAQKRVKSADEILAILNSNKTTSNSNTGDKTIIEPQEKTKPVETTTDKTQFETTRRVATPTSSPFERVGVRKTALYIGIAILAIGILTFAFWQKKQTEVQIENTVVETDSIDNYSPSFKSENWKDKYDHVSRYGNDIWEVSLKEKYGFVDKNGNEIIPVKYDGVKEFDEDLMVVRLNEKRGVVDIRNNLIIPMIYDYIGFISSTANLAPVQLNNKWGFIDVKGNVIIPIRYDNAINFVEKYAKVKLNGETFLIDSNGKRVNLNVYLEPLD